MQREKKRDPEVRDAPAKTNDFDVQSAEAHHAIQSFCLSRHTAKGQNQYRKSVLDGCSFVSIGPFPCLDCLRL